MKLFICMLVTILSLTFSVCADDIIIIAPGMEGLVNKKQTGPYQVILKEAAKRAGINFKEKYYPQKRALKNFLKKEATGMYAFTDVAIEKLGEDQIIKSYPLSVYKMYIFTKKTSPALTSIERLKDKKVGGVLGYEDWYKDITKSGIKMQMVSSDIINLKKLEAGRIDAMISFLPDLNKYVDRLNFSPENPLFISYDCITCHNSEKGRKFIDQISPKLKEMYKDGTIKNILGEYYLEF